MSEDHSRRKMKVDANTLEYEAEWSERPSTGVAIAVAAATERDPVEGPALDDYVDTDALDDLLSGDPPRRGGPVHVSFTYDGVAVSVDSDGGITVRSGIEQTS